MSFINTAAREINCKIVYCGPGMSGKTANLQYLSAKMAPELAAGRMMSAGAPDDDKAFYFDFLAITLGEMRGFKTRFNLYTVPGHVLYDQSRKLILKAADGVVFVADSQAERMEANLEALESMRANLAAEGLALETLPLVFQFNKRDVPHAASVEEMRRMLNPRGAPDFEATAMTGVGVLDTLKSISKLVLQEVKRSAEANAAGAAAAMGGGAAPPATARRGTAP